jgi:hypothetical protein
MYMENIINIEFKIEGALSATKPIDLTVFNSNIP